MSPKIMSCIRRKRGGNKSPLAHCNFPAVPKATQHFNLGPHLAYNRSSDEDSVERPSLDSLQLKILLETVHLTSESVSLDHHVHDAQKRLVHTHVAGHKDQAGARSPHGQ